ncbi:MAG: hypothetical protein HC919_00240 [Oscillatoriales cyanobacterium SM2_2_1]|nr:hypothetical protein [Oscillatoriales cyanobacterium SM2_2_1]
MVPLSALMLSVLTVDVGIQLVILNRIWRSRKHKMQQELHEEEQLTRYDTMPPAEQAKGWEFKILRTSGNGFRGIKTLRRVCQEEAQAGWILLEKLDNHRLRFRRPLAAREQDHLCAIDPYRSYYGLPEELETLMTIAGAIAIMATIGYFSFLKAQDFFGGLQTQAVPTAPTPRRPRAAQPTPPPRKPASQP